MPMDNDFLNLKRGLAPKSRFRPVVITLFSAFLLGAGSCFGFLTTLTLIKGSSWINVVFAWIFILCLVTFLGALVWAVVIFILARIKGE
jgi:hypothetical protein